MKAKLNDDLQGCHGQGKVGENWIYSRSGESQGVLYQVMEFVNLCSKSVNSQEFYLKFAATCFFSFSFVEKAILFKKFSVSHPYLC